MMGFSKYQMNQIKTQVRRENITTIISLTIWLPRVLISSLKKFNFGFAVILKRIRQKEKKIKRGVTARRLC